VFQSAYPSRLQRRPTLWLELLCIFAVDIGSTVHGVERPLDILTCWNKDRGFAVFTAAAGEDCVNNGSAGVTWYDWVNAKGCNHGISRRQVLGRCLHTFVQHPLQVLHVLDLLKRRFHTPERVHLSLQLRPDIRSPGQREPDITQQASRRVAASE